MENHQFLQGDTSSNGLVSPWSFSYSLVFAGVVVILISVLMKATLPSTWRWLRQNSPMKAANRAATARVCSKRDSHRSQRQYQVLVDVGRWFQVSNDFNDFLMVCVLHKKALAKKPSPFNSRVPLEGGDAMFLHIFSTHRGAMLFEMGCTVWIYEFP